MLREISVSGAHYFKDEKDRLQGEYREWWGNGTIFKHYCFIDGLMHGEQNTWFSNGQLFENMQYNSGKRHGEYKTWHKNGEKWCHGFYVKDELHGEYKRWNIDDGLIEMHCFFINNVWVSFKKIPYPQTPEDRMFFKLKYDIPLLNDVKC